MLSPYPHLPHPTVQDQTCRMLPQLLSRSTHYCSSVRNPSAKVKDRRNKGKAKSCLINLLKVRKHLILGFICLILLSRGNGRMSPGFENILNNRSRSLKTSRSQNVLVVVDCVAVVISQPKRASMIFKLKWKLLLQTRLPLKRMEVICFILLWVFLHGQRKTSFQQSNHFNA